MSGNSFINDPIPNGPLMNHGGTNAISESYKLDVPSSMGGSTYQYESKMTGGYIAESSPFKNRFILKKLSKQYKKNKKHYRKYTSKRSKTLNTILSYKSKRSKTKRSKK